MTYSDSFANKLNETCHSDVDSIEMRTSGKQKSKRNTKKLHNITRGQQNTILMTLLVCVILVVAAFIFNRYRRKNQEQFQPEDIARVPRDAQVIVTCNSEEANILAQAFYEYGRPKWEETHAVISESHDKWIARVAKFETVIALNGSKVCPEAMTLTECVCTPHDVFWCDENNWWVLTSDFTRILQKVINGSGSEEPGAIGYVNSIMNSFLNNKPLYEVKFVNSEGEIIDSQSIDITA